MKVNTIMVRKPIDYENMVKDQLTLISKFGASIEKVITPCSKSKSRY